VDHRGIQRWSRSGLALGAVLALSGLAFGTGCKRKDSDAAARAPASQETRPDPQAAITDPPVPPPVTANPLKGARLFVDPSSLAALNANRVRKTDPQKAALLDKIALQPQGLWMGEWNSDIFRAVQHFVGRATEDASVATIIAYNIPHRDAAATEADAGHSAGGLDSKEAYQRWIRNVYAGIGDRPAVVILEPDALPGVRSLPPALQQERLFLLQDAVKVLRQNPKVAVYIDAGHAAWVPAEEMAELLKAAGVEHASGFSLNTSNYRATEECVKYGHDLSERIGGKHFVVDSSRNGAGPYLEAKNETETWCNPPGRKLGLPPTTDTGDAIVDGLLWLKRPGESDGECNGGPRAGVWWEEMALSMVR
jgi:endoglucanase